MLPIKDLTDSELILLLKPRLQLFFQLTSENVTEELFDELVSRFEKLSKDNKIGLTEVSHEQNPDTKPDTSKSEKDLIPDGVILTGLLFLLAAISLD